MSDVRICSTKKLNAFLASANQHLEVELDPDGTHAIQVLHEDWDVFTKLYVCDVVVKALDSNEPHRGRVTLRAQDVDSLSTASVGF